MKIERTTNFALTALVSMFLLAACSGPTGGGPSPGAADGTFVLSLTVNGAGTVLIDEVDLSCRDSCTARVGRDVTVRLVAEPDAGVGFAGWGNACSGFDECTIRMNSDVEVIAEFSSNVLALRFDGDGVGSARIVPPDVTCSDDCGQAFSAPLNASISVSTADGTSVRGWGGVCSDAGTGRYCQVRVEGQTDVRLTLVHPPVADDDAYDTSEDETLTVAAANGVLSNDSDTEGDSLKAELLSQPSKGTISLRPDGSFTYTPRRDENGQDSFEYRARDAFGNVSASANVSVLIHGVDDPLFPFPLQMEVMEDETETGTVQASGGEGNLTFSKATDPVNGTAGLSGTTVTYTPKAHYFGNDEFLFRVTDSAGQSETAKVSVKVVPVNDPPSFTLSSSKVSSSPGASESIANFATSISAGPNESDQDIRFELPRLPDGNLQFDEPPAIDATGRLTFVIAGGSSGSAEFDVILRDDGKTDNGGQDESKPQRFTIEAESTSPPLTAEPMSMSVNEDGSQTETLQGSGGDGNLTYSVVPGSEPTHGDVAIAGSEATYTPKDDYFGDDRFIYKVTDGSGQEDTAEVSIVVASVNDPPDFELSATRVTASPGEYKEVANFATSISPGPTNESSQTVTFLVSETGDLEFAAPPTVAEDGTLTFEVDANGSGSANVSVVLQDSGGTANGGENKSSTKEFDIVVEEPAAALEAESASYTLLEEEEVEITLSSTGGEGTDRTYAIAVAPTNGQALPTEGNPVTYTPDLDFFGADDFEFSVEDASGSKDHGTITLDVQPVNDPPDFLMPTSMVEVPADSGKHSFEEFTTDLSPGPANESGQELTFHVNAVSTGGMTFVSEPSISISGSSGTLAFEVADGNSGEANFEAILHDDGGTDNGGENESEPKPFTIKVASS